jgi:aminopeptidase N
MITCSTWKEIWLNEGFATYANLLCYNNEEKNEEWLALLKKYKTDVMSKDGGSVYAYDTGDVSRMFDYRTTYQKGAMVLHQLRWLIGDDAFFKAIRSYLEDINLKFGFANQKDLKSYMELYSGLNLNDYFDDWIMGEGFPLYNVRWTQNGTILNIETFQTTSHASVNTFNVPLPFLIKGLNRDSLIRVDINSLQEFYSIDLDFKVKELVFDPFEWVMAKAEIQFPVNKNEAFSVYPNPFNDKYYITGSKVEIEGWTLFNINGQIVDKQEFHESQAPGNIIEIDAKAISPGIYFLKLRAEGQENMRKIIKLN